MTIRVQSSPHARGSSWGTAWNELRGEVVPARAGVIPAHTVASSPAESRPRTRGGHPLDVHLAGRTLSSSPHARGSSQALAREVPALQVVPARAGVIPLGVYREVS